MNSSMFDGGVCGATVGLAHGYTPIRTIGRGSFGTATLVRNKEGNLLVLKALDLGNISSKQKEETVAEASVLATLKHPYIVRYQDGFIEDGSLAIVTEFAEGGDLSRRIERVKQSGQTFGESQILRWLTQAALGLKYVHERRIIHRDIKSQNLFLNGADHILLGDFGICKSLPANCSNTTIVEERTIGTPLYFSPEVVNRCEYSFASDMWALGCVLHELAALRLPFEASNLPALAAKIMRGSMFQLPAPFSVELRQICADLLAHDAERRLTCAELVKKPCVKAEMTRMLRDEQRVLASSSQAPLQSRAPSKLRVPMPPSNERDLSHPATPSGTFPTTPSGTLQRVGSAALLQQRPPLSKFPPAEGASCSRASSRQSSRPTSVGSQPGQLSRASSFQSLAASRAGSRGGSRPGSRAGSRDARGLGLEPFAMQFPAQKTMLPSLCKNPSFTALARPPMSAGYAC
eukprot:gb/GFBE01074218.1/.p1 GENE.gb/GFBE01074218.1/~~gb/GFBE01074218.1/.p1  ORF type:complete len:462 (+),score=85.77 gb/GFBE01074218.1/:1-1386(+)